MSVWGKVIGGVGGFVIGGPLGAMMGAVAGHVYDKKKDEDLVGQMHDTRHNSARQAAFTTAIIVLSAKMAKADGQVTREEVTAFKNVFNIAPEEMKAVGMLFDQAKQDAEGFEPYAEQIAEMFAAQPEVLGQLISGLHHIAIADNHFHPGEREFLRQVAAIFGFNEAEYERIINSRGAGASRGSSSGSDPYQVLGVSPETSDAELKKTYRTLIRDNHPDRLTAQGLPQEFIDLANERMAAINAAYDDIEKARGLK